MLYSVIQTPVARARSKMATRRLSMPRTRVVSVWRLPRVLWVPWFWQGEAWRCGNTSRTGAAETSPTRTGVPRAARGRGWGRNAGRLIGGGPSRCLKTGMTCRGEWRQGQGGATPQTSTNTGVKYGLAPDRERPSWRPVEVYLWYNGRYYTVRAIPGSHETSTMYIPTLTNVGSRSWKTAENNQRTCVTWCKKSTLNVKMYCHLCYIYTTSMFIHI